MNNTSLQFRTQVGLLAVLIASQFWMSTADASIEDDELLQFISAAQQPKKTAPVTSPRPASVFRDSNSSGAATAVTESNSRARAPVSVSLPTPVVRTPVATPATTLAASTQALPKKTTVTAPAAGVRQPVLIWESEPAVSVPRAQALPKAEAKPGNAPVRPLFSGQASTTIAAAPVTHAVAKPVVDVKENVGPAVSSAAQQRAAAELNQQQNVNFNPFTAVPEEPVAASNQEAKQLNRLNALPSAAALNSHHKGAGPDENALRAIFYRATQIALQTSPQLRSAQFSVQAAEANVDEAKGQRWPQVDLSTSSRSVQFGGGEKSKQSNVPAVSMNVATTLYDFGQTGHTIDSRKKTANAASSAVNASAEDLAWQVSGALVELSKQRLIIELSQQYVARMKELVKMLSGIVGSDPGRRSELTQARGRELQAQSSLDNALAKARETEITLYKLIGNTEVPLPRTAQWNLALSSMERLLSNVDQHPVLRQAQAQTEAAIAEAKAVRSSNMPKVNWVVSKNTAEDQFGRQQAWQTGVNVSWGLFRGGSGTAAEQAALQRAEAQREQIAEQKRDLDYRIRNADQDARSMLQRADLYRNLTVESDRIRLAFFDQWYHLGKRTLLDVLSAESDYYNNRVAEVTNRFDSYSATFRGYASAGQLIPWLSGNLR
ncbi:TolC family protein [Pantoea sp. GM01]|uniref:TolC family protein n=1 Tax=Pantoea sp. GM01 TaxID=1144320 RepID=UPI00027134D0|nr:TolC family protein [Pantoea sp. GM01]EJL82574.1 outer membrane protein [Pantoea sp. GM01]